MKQIHKKKNSLKKISKPSWLTSLPEDQLISQEDNISPPRNRKIISTISKRKFPYENVTTRKKGNQLRILLKID